MGRTNNSTRAGPGPDQHPDTDADHDTVVAEDRDGTLVGFGHLWPVPPDEIRCFARTHQDRRGQGVGIAMQRHLIARAVELAGERQFITPALTTTSWPHDADCEALLASLGYAPARYFLKMVGDLAVLSGTEAWRGHGLAAALLMHTFTALRERGLPYVALDVDAENTTGAVRLYTSVDMFQRPSFTIWSRALTPG